jgi:cobalt-zinc-cadmium efflux system membrane fusion protein
MNIENNRTRLTAMAAGLAIVAGVGGVMIGRTLAPEQPAQPQTTEAKAEEANGPEGFVAMDAARAAAAGIVSETTTARPLGGEILAQGVVAATPEGEAALTARADGAVVRINKRLGDYVRAGETVALLESREAAAIAAERSTASAKATAARSAYAREKRLYDARVTARQDLEAAQANLRETEAELRRTQGAAAAAKVSGGVAIWPYPA